MFSSIKAKITSGILLLPFLLQSFPGAALGYDVLGRLRNFVSTQVKTSDEIINPNKLKIKESFQKAADWYEGKWLGGLSLLESKTGLSEENNKAYKALKSYNLFNLGFNAGVVNCAGSLAAETYTLVAKIPTAPERIVKFTFDYREDPDKYHAMVTDTALAVAGVAMNAIPLLEQGKDAYLDAAKDPLKFGHINGEITAFAGSFLIGGGQVKALSSAQRLEKAAGVASSAKKAEKIAGTASSATPIISSPLDALTKGWKNWLNGRTTFVTAAKDGSLPANKEIPLVITGYNQKVYNLGVVEKGTPKLYDEIDLRPEDLRALKSIDEIWDKQWEYQELLFSIEKLDLDILDMVKRKEMRAKDGLKSAVILEQSHEKVKDALRLLQKEKERITEVQVFRERDLAGIYNVEKLGNLEKELVSKIKTFEESGTTSKALLLEHEKLLEEVRLLKERRSTVDKFTLAVYDLNGELHILGHVDKKGKATFLDEIDFKPQQLRALTVSDVLDKKNEYLWFQTQIQDYDRGLREMLKNGDVTKSTVIGANQILDQAILDTTKSLATLDKEIERIIDVQRIRFLDLRFLYSKDNLRELEVTVTSALGALKEGGTASKGLLSEFNKLLEQVRLAQKPESFYDYYIRTAYHTVSTPRFVTNLKTVFSPGEMVKLREEAMKDAAKLDEIEKRLMLKGDANALRRAQRAKENSNLFLYLINSTKMAVEERLAGFSVTRSLLKKEDRLSASFTIDELKRLQRDVEKDLEFLSQVGTEKHILSLNKQLLDRIKTSMTKPTPTEGNFAVITTGIQSDQFLQGVIIETSSLSKLKELGNEGKNLLKALRDEEEEIVDKFHGRQINAKEAADLLVKNDFKQRRLKYKIDILWKYIEANK